MLTKLTLAACAALAAAPVCAAEPQLIEPDNPQIQYTGRIDFKNPKLPRFDWGNVSIAASFNGKTIGVKLKDTTNDYNAFIDGKLVKVISADGDKTYLIEGLEEGNHTLLLTKRTSSSFGIGRFAGLVLDNGAKLLPPPARPKHKIEVVGDSFSVGFGNEGPAKCENLRPYENGYLSYSAIAARALDAEVHITAVSGTGMVRNWAAPEQTSPNPMPSYFDRTVHNDEASKWDFSSWIPEAVVINLGNNDYSTKPNPEHELYVGRYLEFIARIRSYYGNVPVFCMGRDFYMAHVADAVKRANDGGDKNVFLVKYVHDGEKDGYGCALHPSVKSQQKIADALVTGMRAALNW